MEKERSLELQLKEVRAKLDVCTGDLKMSLFGSVSGPRVSVFRNPAKHLRGIAKIKHDLKKGEKNRRSDSQESSTR